MAMEIHMALLVVGLAMSLIGVLLLVLASLRSGARAEGGAVVVVGPVPIVFGSSPRIAVVLMAMALAIMAMYLALVLIWAS